MVPTPADIARYRHVAAAVIRGVGLLLLLYSATRVSMYLWQHLDQMARQFNSGASVRRYVSGLSLQTVLLIFSVVAICWPGWIARWLVPARVRAACPGCGFSAAGLRSDRCPECGLVLGAEFRDMKVEGSESE